MKRYEEMAVRLVSWFKDHDRGFPWRKTRDPYKILVAELMLQKTRAEAVEKVYKDFLLAFPNIRALAKASVSEVRKIIGRLGLAYRAERFVKIAKLVEAKHKGKFPHGLDEILELPGVGPYIANSLLCFAFDRPALIVDSNVMRIMNRFSGITSERAVRNLLEGGLRRVSARELNLALIDLGSLICTPRRPKHGKCPIEELCEKRPVTPQRWKFLRKVKSGKLIEQ